MKNVVSQFENASNVAFGMLFMQQPEAGDQLASTGATMTSTYTTTCGVNNDSPDDGESSSKDDA